VDFTTFSCFVVEFPFLARSVATGNKPLYIDPNRDSFVDL
jgi:hypothetical protein